MILFSNDTQQCLYGPRPDWNITVIVAACVLHTLASSQSIMKWQVTGSSAPRSTTETFTPGRHMGHSTLQHRVWLWGRGGKEGRRRKGEEGSRHSPLGKPSLANYIQYQLWHQFHKQLQVVQQPFTQLILAISQVGG